MKILITGGGGFIGKHILSKFENSDTLELLVLSRSLNNSEFNRNRTSILFGSLENFEDLKHQIKLFNPDTVIHLAWHGIPNFSVEKSLFNLNISINFLNFIIDETDCKKLIVSGSCFEYGTSLGECQETDYIMNTSYIAWAKNSLYEFLKLKCTKKGIKLFWFRIFYVYGPGQRENSIMPLLYKSLINGEIPNIRSPLNKNDYIYIDDVVNAFYLALNSIAKSGIYNLSSGYSISVYEICKILEFRIRGNFNLSHELQNINQNDIDNFWGKNTKSFEELNWIPKFSIEEGIVKTLNYYNNIFNK